MKRGVFAFASLLALAAAGCGDDSATPDATNPPSDGANLPVVPALGAQIDRVGRPAINTALVGLLGTTGVAEMKQAYGEADEPASWPTTVIGPGNRTILAELAANLAILDVLDQSLGNAGTGCGNQTLYNANHTATPTQPAADSYAPLATLLADDQLYVDTARTSCAQYLALEIEAASSPSSAHAQCGGRAPSHDVIDASYSLLTAGLTAGFTPGSAGTLTPKLGDTVGKHADVSDTAFPFLGAPN